MMALPILPGTTAMNTKSLTGADAADEEDLPSESGGDDLNASPALNGFASLLAAVLPTINSPAEPSSTADGASAGAAVEEISANPRPAWKSAETIISSWNAAPPPAPLGAESGTQAGAEARLLNEVKSLVRQATAEMGVRTTVPRETFADAATPVPAADAAGRTLEPPTNLSSAQTTVQPVMAQASTPKAVAAIPDPAGTTAQRAEPTINAGQSVSEAEAAAMPGANVAVEQRAKDDAGVAASPRVLPDAAPVSRAPERPFVQASRPAPATVPIDARETSDDTRGFPAEIFNVRLEAADKPAVRIVRSEAPSLLVLTATAPDKGEPKGLTFTSLRLDDVTRTEVPPVVEVRSMTGPAAEQEPSKVVTAESVPVPEKVQTVTPLKPALREAARVTAELLRPTVNVPRAMPSVPDSSSSPQPLLFVSPPSNDMTRAAVDVARATVNTPIEITVTSEAAPITPNAMSEAVAAPQGTEIAPSPTASNFDKKAAVDATSVNVASAPSPALSPATVPQPITGPRVLPEPLQRITNTSAVSETPKRTPGRDAKSVAGTTSGEVVRGRSESRPVAQAGFTAASESADSGTGPAETSERQPGGGKREGQSSLAQEGAKESAPASLSDAVSDVSIPHAMLHAAPAAHEVRPADPRHAESVITQTTTQLVNAAESTARHETRTLRFDLRPEHLGRVEVELTRSGEGHVRAHLTAERADAGQSLNDGIGQLRESLERAGVTVDRLDVSVRTDLSAASGHGQQRQQEHSSQATPASSAYPGLEQPEADDAPRAVEEDRIISLRA